MKTGSIQKIRILTAKLNTHRNKYYNQNAPSISDAEYNKLYDELEALEKESGFMLSNSPTQSVGYPVVSGLPKVAHPIPLLSLDKIKSVDEMHQFIGTRPVLLMNKLDGLTVKLEYVGGSLRRASTRGDGDVGEDITHNMRAFRNVPREIPYKEILTLSGEAYILKSDFERLSKILTDSEGKPYKNARNLAAGSVRCFDSAECAQRCVNFAAFNVLEGLDENPVMSNSKHAKLLTLEEMGFSRCNYFFYNSAITRVNTSELSIWIDELDQKARENGIPIDGIVVTYNDIAYSRSCGRTGHHYKDGLAFKFEDDTFDTRFRCIEWNTSRFGVITPVAIFDTVEIEGSISRATLSNVSIVKKFRLAPGCRIMISKRNQIIPHVEENLEPFDGEVELPDVCPCCGAPVEIRIGKKHKGEEPTETLHCLNEHCPARNIAKFSHFVSKKAMNIEGLAESSLEKFIGAGWIRNFTDIYHLDEYKDKIIRMDGFGEKSFDRLWASINESRITTFDRFVISCDIPMVGKNASAILADCFDGDLAVFEKAALDGFLFFRLPGIGQTIHDNICAWFKNADNLALWNNLKKEVTIMLKNTQMGADASTGNPFAGKTVVVTGTLTNYTRSEIESKLLSLGAKAGSSVSSKTNYVLAGEKAGSKLTKARSLGIKVISEDEFNEMLSA
jgi:DNA ligase (NAD+)